MDIDSKDFVISEEGSPKSAIKQKLGGTGRFSFGLLEFGNDNHPTFRGSDVEEFTENNFNEVEHLMKQLDILSDVESIKQIAKYMHNLYNDTLTNYQSIKLDQEEVMNENYQLMCEADELEELIKKQDSQMALISEDLAKKEELYQKLEEKCAKYKENNLHLEQTIRVMPYKNVEYDDKTKDTQQMSKQISHLEMSYQSSQEHIEKLRSENNNLRDQLTVKELKILKHEKDQIFSQVQLQEYETQVNNLVKKYNEIHLKNTEKTSENKQLLKRIQAIEQMLTQQQISEQDRSQINGGLSEFEEAQQGYQPGVYEYQPAESEISRSQFDAYQDNSKMEELDQVSNMDMIKFSDKFSAYRRESLPTQNEQILTHSRRESLVSRPDVPEFGRESFKSSIRKTEKPDYSLHQNQIRRLNVQTPRNEANQTPINSKRFTFQMPNESCVSSIKSRLCTSPENSVRSCLRTHVAERDFFKFTVLSAILNTPTFMLEQVCNKNPSEMYKRARRDGIRFNNFYEWVQNDINKTIFSQDANFIELERQWIQNKK